MNKIIVLLLLALGVLATSGAYAQNPKKEDCPPATAAKGNYNLALKSQKAAAKTHKKTAADRQANGFGKYLGRKNRANKRESEKARRDFMSPKGVPTGSNRSYHPHFGKTGPEYKKKLHTARRKNWQAARKAKNGKTVPGAVRKSRKSRKH